MGSTGMSEVELAEKSRSQTAATDCDPSAQLGDTTRSRPTDVPDFQGKLKDEWRQFGGAHDDNVEPRVRDEWKNVVDEEMGANIGDEPDGAQEHAKSGWWCGPFCHGHRSRARSAFQKVRKEVEVLQAFERAEEDQMSREERRKLRDEWKEILENEIHVVKAFGWNPYTRRYCRPHWMCPTDDLNATRKERYRATRFWTWRWRSLNWWIAFAYMMGAILFIIGSITSLFQAIEDSQSLYSGLTLTPYLAGGIFFFIGTSCMFVVSVQVRHTHKHNDERERIIICLCFFFTLKLSLSCRGG